MWMSRAPVSTTKHRDPRRKIAVWYQCEFCDYKNKRNSNLTQHKADRHDIDVVWHSCDVCSYRAKRGSSLTQHKASQHNIDAIWYECHLCLYRAKTNGHLTRHKAQRHDINVVWHNCSICDYRAKQNSTLTRHMSLQHNIFTKPKRNSNETRKRKRPQAAQRRDDMKCTPQELEESADVAHTLANFLGASTATKMGKQEGTNTSSSPWPSPINVFDGNV